MQIVFAKDDRAGFFELADNRRVVVRHKLFQNLRARRGPNILRIDIVLQRNRDPVKRPAIPMALPAPGCKKLAFRFFCLGESKFPGNGEICVELWIELLDPRQHQLGEFDRRKLAFPEKFSDFFDGGKREVGVGHPDALVQGTSGI